MTQSRATDRDRREADAYGTENPAGTALNRSPSSAAVAPEEAPNVQEGDNEEIESVGALLPRREAPIAVVCVAALYLHSDLRLLPRLREMAWARVNAEDVVALVPRRSLVREHVAAHQVAHHEALGALGNHGEPERVARHGGTLGHAKPVGGVAPSLVLPGELLWRLLALHHPDEQREVLFGQLQDPTLTVHVVGGSCLHLRREAGERPHRVAHGLPVAGPVDGCMAAVLVDLVFREDPRGVFERLARHGADTIEHLDLGEVGQKAIIDRQLA